MSKIQLKRILAFVLCMCLMIAYVPMAQAATLAITKHPSNVTVPSGQTATVSVGATGDGLTYRWYYKDAGNSTYSASSATTATYSLSMTAARDGRRVYCRVTDANGNFVNSNSALLSVAPAVKITKQPVSVNVASGSTATVSVTASGDGLSYRWYYKDAGSSAFGKSGVTSSSYSLIVTSANAGRQVYCVVTDKYGKTAQSNTVTLGIAVPAKITKQPSNVTVASGATATVSVTATGDGLSYRWYYKDAGSTTYSASSATTATYSLAMNAARDGRRVYCRVTDKYGNTVNSNSALLSLAAGVKITKQPANVTVASGATGTVSVTATGDGLTYRWYYKDPGATAFGKSSVTTASYSLLMSSARSGRQVYCIVTDKYGNTAQSSTVTLTMAVPVKITKQPANASVASGATASVSVTAAGDGLTYRWYYKDPGATAFGKSSVTTASYSLLMSAARSGRQVYCIVTDKYGNTAQSNTVTLTMVNPISITKQPANVVAANGTTASVSVTATGDGLTYRWYYKDPGATAFGKSSVTTASYSLLMSSARSGRQVYCVVTDKNGNTLTSDTATLYMGTPLKITKQPGNVATNTNKTANVTIEAVGEGVTYRWYYADASATTFSKSSVTATSYSLLMSSARHGRRVYCVVTDKFGNTLTSSTATLYVGNPLVITQQPEDTIAAVGKTAEVTIAATGDGVTYRWYYADGESTTFSKSSVTANTYSLIMSEARDGRRVYCELTDKYGQKVNSAVATLNALANITDDGLGYEIVDSQVNIIAYVGTGTQVVIPSTLDGLPVKKIAEAAFADCNKVTSITIPESVTSIGKGAFARCTALTSLKVPSKITVISVEMCDGCTGLASVSLPNGVTAIAARAFRGCTSLKNMTSY